MRRFQQQPHTRNVSLDIFTAVCFETHSSGIWQHVTG